jgi:hypothetical protein
MSDKESRSTLAGDTFTINPIYTYKSMGLKSGTVDDICSLWNSTDDIRTHIQEVVS